MWSCLFAQSVSKMNYVNRSLNVSQFCIPGTNLLDREVLFLNIVGFDIFKFCILRVRGVFISLVFCSAFDFQIR